LVQYGDRQTVRAGLLRSLVRPCLRPWGALNAGLIGLQPLGGSFNQGIVTETGLVAQLAKLPGT
jgi:hypothetical protein